MKIIILAGGKGIRLWPFSREKSPKQFLKLFGNESPFQKTLKRFIGAFSPENIVIVTNQELRWPVRDQIQELGYSPGEFLIVEEPVSRNTASAIALAVKFLEEKGYFEVGETLVVCPSDHLIKPEKDFLEALKLTQNRVDYVFTFGIKPKYPETGYGYIEAGEKILEGVFKVRKFLEKPSLEKAKEFLAQGNFFWNTGIFAFEKESLKEEYRCHAPEIYQAIFEMKSLEEILKNYPTFPAIYRLCHNGKNFTGRSDPFRGFLVGCGVLGCPLRGGGKR